MWPFKKKEPETLVMSSFEPEPSHAISQPVAAILDAMRDRPETFEISYSVSDESAHGSVISDTYTGFTATIRYGFSQQTFGGFCRSFACVPEWITSDEARLILSAAHKIEKDNKDANNKRDRQAICDLYGVSTPAPATQTAD